VNPFTQEDLLSTDTCSVNHFTQEDLLSTDTCSVNHFTQEDLLSTDTCSVNHFTQEDLLSTDTCSVHFKWKYLNDHSLTTQPPVLIYCISDIEGCIHKPGSSSLQQNKKKTTFQKLVATFDRKGNEYSDYGRAYQHSHISACETDCNYHFSM
jgi:hypothetical protein